MNEAFRAGTAAGMSPVGTLDRREAVPALVGNPQDWLIVAGLAGTAKDTAAMCEPEANYLVILYLTNHKAESSVTLPQSGNGGYAPMTQEERKPLAAGSASDGVWMGVIRVLGFIALGLLAVVGLIGGLNKFLQKAMKAGPDG